MTIANKKAEPAAADINKRSFVRVVGIVLFCLWGGFALLLGYELKISYQQEYEVAAETSSNLSRLIEQHLTTWVAKVDVVLRETAHDYGAKGTGFGDKATDNRDLLRRMEVIPETLHRTLRITDAEGRFLRSAGDTAALPTATAGDRAYFHQTRDDPAAGLVISEPIFSRINSLWVIVFARRLDTEGFTGLVQAAIPAGEFQALFERLLVKRSDTSLALYDTRLRLVARQPAEPDMIGKAVPMPELEQALKGGRDQGLFDLVSPVDGVRRLYSFRKVQGLPFIVVTGSAPEKFMANWRRKCVLYAFSLLAVTLELAGLIWLMNRRLRQRVRYVQSHDSVTGLPNRLGLDAQLPTDDGKPMPMALLVIDLDHFKNINDTLGHKLGDVLLGAVAERLKSALRDSDSVVRQGGDEFTVLLRGISGSDVVGQRARGLLDALAQPYLIDGNELTISGSIGIALYPDDGADEGTLLKNADTALYQAKAGGRNSYRFFAPEMNQRLAERMATESSLRKAVQRNELVLHYQPQFETVSGALIGFEALLRWNHPELGMVPPGRFIPVAEETGLIIPIGEWVLREACRQNKAWQNSGASPVVMAVNLSAVQFRQPDLVAKVQAVLDETGLDPAWLELEVTESVLMRDIDEVISVLHDLKRLGVRLSIDDFGTGYSSLNYLKRFPIDKIKIDQCFVRDVQSSPDDSAIVEAVIAMAGKLGMRAIAEGVETAEHLECMRAFGCDEVQGFLFSPAVPPEQAKSFLRHTVPAEG